MVLCGMPLFYLELIIGQFSSLSPLSVWRLCPMFKGETKTIQYNIVSYVLLILALHVIVEYFNFKESVGECW